MQQILISVLRDAYQNAADSELAQWQVSYTTGLDPRALRGLRGRRCASVYTAHHRARVSSLVPLFMFTPRSPSKKPFPVAPTDPIGSWLDEIFQFITGYSSFSSVFYFLQRSRPTVWSTYPEESSWFAWRNVHAPTAGEVIGFMLDEPNLRLVAPPIELQEDPNISFAPWFEELWSGVSCKSNCISEEF